MRFGKKGEGITGNEDVKKTSEIKPISSEDIETKLQEINSELLKKPRKKRLQEMFDDLIEIQRISPEDSRVYFLKGGIYEYLGEVSSSIASFDRSVDIIVKTEELPLGHLIWLGYAHKSLLSEKDDYTELGKNKDFILDELKRR